MGRIQQDTSRWTIADLAKAATAVEGSLDHTRDIIGGLIIGHSIDELPVRDEAAIKDEVDNMIDSPEDALIKFTYTMSLVVEAMEYMVDYYRKMEAEVERRVLLPDPDDVTVPDRVPDDWA